MLYSTLPGLVLAFHGCDREVGESVLGGTSQLKKSENKYDWLGHGIYFWENNPERALQFAKEGLAGNRGREGKIKDPFVIGAVIDLGHCLNLLDSAALAEVKEAHRIFKESVEEAGYLMPKNQEAKSGQDSLKRNLDCAVISALHQIREVNESAAYDSARGVFWEGKELYPGTTMKEKNHIQVCVRNPNCIKGYFRVRQADMAYVLP